MQLAESSKFLFSPIIAGLLLSITTIEVILIIDIFTFVIAILAVFAIRKGMQTPKKDAERQHFLKELEEGWNAIVSNKSVLLLITIISIITLTVSRSAGRSKRCECSRIVSRSTI